MGVYSIDDTVVALFLIGQTDSVITNPDVQHSPTSPAEFSLRIVLPPFQLLTVCGFSSVHDGRPCFHFGEMNTHTHTERHTQRECYECPSRSITVIRLHF